MMTTDADRAALAHYEELIGLRYPPHLACALAAARYAQSIATAEKVPLPLPALRKVVEAARDVPALRREAGRMVATIEREMGLG